MTRKHRGIIAFLPFLLFGLIGPLQIQGQEMVKVGVIQIDRAIFESEEGKAAMADLQKKVDAKQEEFAKQQKEIQDLQGQIQRQGATLNQEAQAALARNLERKQITFQRATEDAQREFNQLRTDIYNRIGRKIAVEVQKYAAENNFYLILNSSSQNSQVLFNDNSVDITSDIIKRFNLAQTSPASPSPQRRQPPSSGQIRQEHRHTGGPPGARASRPPRSGRSPAPLPRPDRPQTALQLSCRPTAGILALLVVERVPFVFHWWSTRSFCSYDSPRFTGECGLKRSRSVGRLCPPRFPAGNVIQSRGRLVLYSLAPSH